MSRITPNAPSLSRSSSPNNNKDTNEPEKEERPDTSTSNYFTANIDMNVTQVKQNRTLKKSVSADDISSLVPSLNLKNNQSLEKVKPKYDYFAVNYDDSSDEEDTKEKIKNYNFEERWGSYSKTRINVFASEVGNGVTEQQIHRSFLLHAIGIKMLYARHINDTYYRLKNEFLSTTVDEVKNQLSKIIKNIIANIFLSLCKFLDNNASTVQVNIKKYTNEIIKESETLITQVVADEKILFAQNENQLTPVFQENINHLIEILIKKFSSFKDECRYEKPEINNLAKKYKSELIPLAKQRAIDELKKLNWLDENGKCKNINKRPKITSNEDNSNVTKTTFPKLVTKCYLHLETVANGGNRADKALNSIPEIELAALYLTDLKNLSENDFKDFKESEREIEYLSYIWKAICNPESKLDLMLLFDNPRLIKEAVSEQFFIQLDEKLKAIQRKTLGVFFEFTSNSKHDFISNLRLSNRSQTRAIKNFKHSPLLIKESGNSKETVHRNWRFNSSGVAIESQIIRSKQTRQDEVDNAGSYKEIYERLKSYKEYFSEIVSDFVTDVNIATWINDIYNGRSLNGIDIDVPNDLLDSKQDIKKLKEFLIGLTYLLMGCEVVRNPASLPIHQMMLDLIIAKKLTWKEALTNTLTDNKLESGGKMPMSAVGAVSVGRYLHNEFNNYMPHLYNYQGPSYKKQDNFTVFNLIEKELWILEQWLELNPISNEKTLFQHLIDSLAQIDLNKELPSSNVVIPAAKVNSDKILTFFTGTKYEIQPTSGERCNCLIYAITKGVAKDINRSKIFTTENIERRLRQIYNIDNSDSNTDKANFNTLKEMVISIYDEASESLKDSLDISKLALNLSEHINTSNCFLDSQLVAPILAAELKQKTIIITPPSPGNLTGNLSYIVIDNKGTISEDMGNIREETLREIESDPNNVFIFNKDGKIHFEWLKRVV